MKIALIGHTGFVGGTLKNLFQFTHFYNSRNIATISGQSFDLLICAGAPGVKWKANKDPDGDKAAIEILISCLQQCNARQALLISTIDVYGNPVGVNELNIPNLSTAQPYGRHRRLLEIAFERIFSDSFIVRLPGLFGEGLKKNIIFDMLTLNQINLINPASVFQFYDLSDLGPDLKVVLSEGLPLVNFATEPVSTRLIAELLVPDFHLCEQNQPAAVYDMQTRYASYWKQNGTYFKSVEQVMLNLQNFAALFRRRMV